MRPRSRPAAGSHRADDFVNRQVVENLSRRHARWRRATTGAVTLCPDGSAGAGPVRYDQRPHRWAVSTPFRTADRNARSAWTELARLDAGIALASMVVAVPVAFVVSEVAMLRGWLECWILFSWSRRGGIRRRECCRYRPSISCWAEKFAEFSGAKTPCARNLRYAIGVSHTCPG